MSLQWAESGRLRADRNRARGYHTGKPAAGWKAKRAPTPRKGTAERDELDAYYEARWAAHVEDDSALMSPADWEYLECEWSLSQKVGPGIAVPGPVPSGQPQPERTPGGAQMAPDNSTDPEARRAALTLLAQGQVTLSEAAELAGVSRQLVRYWANVAKLDWRKARSAYLAKLWRKEIKRP